MSPEVELAKSVLHHVKLYNKEVIVLASNVLADRVDELEKLICDGLCNFPQLLNDNTVLRCDNCEQCLKVKELLL